MTTEVSPAPPVVPTAPAEENAVSLSESNIFQPLQEECNKSLEALLPLFVDNLKGFNFIDAINGKVYMNEKIKYNISKSKGQGDGIMIKMDKGIFIRVAGTGLMQKQVGQKHGEKLVWSLSDVHQSIIIIGKEIAKFIRENIKDMLDNVDGKLDDFFPTNFHVSITPSMRVCLFHQKCTCDGDLNVCTSFRLNTPSTKPIKEIAQTSPQEIIVADIARKLRYECTTFQRSGTIEYFENNDKKISSRLVGDKKDIRNWLAIVSALVPQKKDSDKIRKAKKFASEKWKWLLERVRINEGIHYVECIVITKGSHFSLYGSTTYTTEFSELTRVNKIDSIKGFLQDVNEALCEELEQSVEDLVQSTLPSSDEEDSDEGEEDVVGTKRKAVTSTPEKKKKRKDE